MIEVTDNINTLRNAIRKELGFGKDVDFNTETAWFVRLAGDERDSEVEISAN